MSVSIRLCEVLQGHTGKSLTAAAAVFCALAELAYRNRRLRYTENLVFCAARAHALIPGPPVDAAGLGATDGAGLADRTVYTLMAMKHVCGGRSRTQLVSTLYGTTLSLALARVALVTLLS